MRKLNIASVLLLLFSALLFGACNSDLGKETDVTDYHWKVRNILRENVTFKAPNANVHGNSLSGSAYVLSFQDDSQCAMTFSINNGGGVYFIKSPGKITISLQSLTEICCDNDFDKELSQAFDEVREYSLRNKSLILRGDKISIQLEKE